MLFSVKNRDFCRSLYILDGRELGVVNLGPHDLGTKYVLVR